MVVVLREFGRTMPDRRMEVQVSVIPLATSSAQHKIAADRGRTSSLQFLQLLLATLVLSPMSKPLPSALEGLPAPNPDATPCRSSQTSALGELQTGCTMLGAKQRKSSLRLATQHVHCKVPCNVQSLTARNPHTSTHFQNNAQNHATHNTPQMFDPNRRPYATERLLFTQTHTATQWQTCSSSCSFPVSVRAGRVDA